MVMKKLATMFVLAIACALNAIAPTHADVIGGSRYGDYTIPPHTTRSFQVAFYHSEHVRVTVEGYGYSDVDLDIYDEWGNLINSGHDITDSCLAQWYVSSAAVYTFRVANHGITSITIAISTN